MPAVQSPEFEAAVVASKQLVNKPSDDDLLEVSLSLRLGDIHRQISMGW